MKKQRLLIISAVALLGLFFVVLQYYQSFKAEDVSAVTAGPHNPGHLLSSLECSADSLCVDTTNNRIGIGTSDPDARLQVDGGAIRVSADQINGNFSDFNIASGNLNINNSYYGSGSYGGINLLTSGVSRMFIKSDGNVGIGTTAPTSKLYANATNWDATTNPAFKFYGYQSSNSSTVPLFHIQSGWENNLTANTFKVNTYQNEAGFNILANGNVGIGTTVPGFGLEIASNTAGMKSSRSNAVEFHLNNTESGVGHDWTFVSWGSAAGSGTLPGKFSIYDNTAGDHRMVIDTNGKVGIGTASPGYNLTVAGTAWVTSGSWSGSDARWKKNVSTLSTTSSLDKILKLKPVTYNWKTDEYPEMKFSDGSQLGFIAQDVESIIPEVVTTDNNGYKGISYEKIVPVLTSAIQEQQKEIDNLSNENKSLKELICLDHPFAEVCK